MIMVPKCLADSSSFDSCSILCCYAFREGSGLLSPLPMLQQQSCGPQAGEGEQSRWAAQLSPLRPRGGTGGGGAAGAIEGQRRKKEKRGGVPGLRSEEEEKGDTASFRVSQHHKNTQKVGGGGVAQGEVQVEQQLWLSSQIHGKSSFHPLRVSDARPLTNPEVA